MKLYIKAASVPSSLTLAKGIYIDYYNMDYNKRADYQDFYIDNKFISGFLFISEAEYYPATGELSNNLLNHDQLLSKYHLEDIPSNELSYFRIDLNSSKTGTQLTSSGVHSRGLDEYLAKLFNVSIGDNALPDNWISCDSDEYSSTFKTAAARCQKYIYDLQKKTVTELSDYSRPNYFAFCFAIVDPDNNSALISDSLDGVLFASPSYEAYRADTQKIARELGKSSPKELSFKTLYYEFTSADYRAKAPGSFATKVNQARTIAKKLRSMYPRITDVVNSNYDCHIFLDDDKEFAIQVKPELPEVDLYQIGTDYFQLSLPQDFSEDEISLKTLYNLMINADKYAHS